jgi:hypothetical protein
MHLFLMVAIAAALTPFKTNAYLSRDFIESGSGGRSETQSMMRADS